MVVTMDVSAAPASSELSAAPVATATTKKCPPNIRTGTVQPPVLVSPISVAHSNAMLGVDGSKKGGANWMRDQWVANLKKKRMGGPGGAPGTDAPVATASMGPVPTVKAGVRAETSRSTGEKTTTSRSKRSTKSKNAAAANATASVASVQGMMPTADKDSLSLMHPALFFNDLGCFELESPSFMRLTPTTRDGLSDSLLDAGILPSPGHGSASLKADKKWMKPLMKKRSNCFAADLNSEPKRRTPRRPNTSAGTFDDSDCSAASSPHSYTSVGTPSNFHSADVSRMWGPELDLPNGYVDTFLDLPTPKSAEMPTVTARTPSSQSRAQQSSEDLEQPKLIRTTSIEQEGLSQFFEQTRLGGESELRQPTKTGKSQSYNVSTTAAAAHAVDEYFGKMAPSPANYAFSNARCLQPTPKSSLRVHHASSDYSFDQPQKMTGSNPHATSSSSEFDTLVQDYEFTDFDQELDSFYLDTIESFGGDLDLISS